jgi:hypothetical protein
MFHWLPTRLFAKAVSVDLSGERHADAIAQNEALREQLKTALLRFDLVGKSEALWDMEYPKDGKILPQTPFLWSEHFRKLLRFQDEHDFPNVLDSWGSRLHSTDKDRTFAAFAAHLEDRSGRTPYDIEYQLQTKSGEYRWYLARGYTLRDGAGNPLRVCGSLRDIHEEKLLNLRLTKSKDQLQGAISDVRTQMAALLQQAEETAQSTNDKMGRLDSRSREVRKVNAVISEIAQTSNLLALNAMIEAARAGELGAGFTVVAEEVKRLATRTSAATEDVASQTHAIADEIGLVASAVQNFQEIIQQIETMQNQLTATIEAQTTDLSA